MHNPPLQALIDQLLAEACHNAAAALSAGSPTHHRLREAHALAQRLDVCLTPSLGCGPLTIGLVHGGGLNACLAAIHATGLSVESISDEPVNPQGTRHEITLVDHEFRVAAYTMKKEPA